MPWNVETDNPECSGYAVVVANDGGPNDGEVVGCHDTKAEAEAQQRALYSNNTQYRIVRVAELSKKGGES